ncbi:hypothetical protein LPB142_04910 [Rhodobacter xanthinilyticus]|uniref:Uncharacterized protein n=1 Tax=Rhodobacter xanthinilyticus TaxID=1850250 RepID=A0A1D9MAB3_9RHOB|nr:hypothetical protein [Rhodobacter xanthinilyticus]AOZ68738.1 hypothetical protein LPB142_04910 [Rhodobacter xanthinilyticus]
MRPDFHVLGPARPADPHIELEFLNPRLYPELSSASGLALGTPAMTTEQQAYPPYFRGTRDAAFLPDVICNDHGLPLWKDALVETLIAIDRFTPMSRIRARIGIKGARKPLAEGATILLPKTVYGDEVIDWDEIARRDPEWAAHGRPAGLRPQNILLREEFRPKAQVFRLRLLGREQIVLGERLGAALCGPNAEIALRHCHAARLSELGYDQTATLGATPPDRYAALLEAHLQAAKAAPGPRANSAAPALSEAERSVRGQVLAMFARIGAQPLSGNRETWSRLELAGGRYRYVCGQTESPEVSSRTVSEQEAWNYLRARAAEGLGLYTTREKASARPEAILDYYQSIWRGPLSEGGLAEP